MTPSENTALVIVNMQRAFDLPGFPRRNNQNLDKNAQAILAAWRRKRHRFIVHVRHDSVELDSPFSPQREGHQFRAGFMPLGNELLISKSTDSAFDNSIIHEKLQSHNIQELVMIGWSSEHCLAATARDAAKRRYKVKIVDDASATPDRKDRHGVVYAEDIHRAQLAILSSSQIQIVNTAEALDKQIQSLPVRSFAFGYNLQFSNRERQCLSMVAQGYSAKEIAIKLNISPRTVEHHIQAARQRIGARNISHAIAISIRSGILLDNELTYAC